MAIGTQDNSDEMMSEINMIPFIDVMLVLLIIFIITVPVIKHAVNVEKLTTRTESGPMSSGMLFRADADLTAPPALDARMLKADLEAISNDLMVEIALVQEGT